MKEREQEQTLFKDLRQCKKVNYLLIFKRLIKILTSILQNGRRVTTQTGSHPELNT